MSSFAISLHASSFLFSLFQLNVCLTKTLSLRSVPLVACACQTRLTCTPAS